MRIRARPARPYPSPVRKFAGLAGAHALLRPHFDRMANPLLPREHGAYGQLAVPLATGLVLGRFHLPAVFCATAAVAAFLAHEPLLVELGHRGPKAKREHGTAARIMLMRTLAIACLFGAAGFATAPGLALLAGLPAFALGTLVLVLVFRRKERSLLGEVLVSITLAAALVPVALAGGAELPRAIGAVVVVAGGFTLVTASVRGVIARSKRDGSAALAWIAGAAAPLAVLAAYLTTRANVRLGVALGLAPFAAFAVVMAVTRVGPRALTRLGWSLVAASVLASIAVVAGTMGG